LEMEPARPMSFTPFYGSPNSGVLNRLNASARNCRFQLSVNLKFLKTEKSTLYCAGPRKVPRPALPKTVAKVWPGATAGTAKAAGLYQHWMVCRLDGHPALVAFA